MAWATAIFKGRSTEPGKSYRQRLRANSGFLFVAPALLLFLIFGLYTVIYSFVLSFFRWKGFTKFSILPPVCEPPGCAFVGLQNFKSFLFADRGVSSLFWQAMQNNVVIAICVPAGTILIGLLLAIALNRGLRGWTFYRTVMMLPMVTTGIAIYFAWTFIYLSDGPLNTILKTVGLSMLQAKHGWLGQANTALPALMAVMIWSAVPQATILYLAGLQTIDRELYEAAIIDGAGAWPLLWNITWPLLTPMTLIIFILGINAALQGFEMPLLMTKGGPANHTQVVGLRIFNFGFGDDLQLGIASAMGWGLFAIVFLISLVSLWVFRPRTENEGG